MMPMPMPGGPGPGAMPPGGGMPGEPPDSGPSAAPMSTPQEPQGLKQGGMVKVAMALEMLQQALPEVGSHTEEGKSLLRALTQLSKHFGKPKEKELVPSEIASMVGSMPSAGGGGPDLQAMMKQQGAPQQMQPGGPPGMM